MPRCGIIGRRRSASENYHKRFCEGGRTNLGFLVVQPNIKQPDAKRVVSDLEVLAAHSFATDHPAAGGEITVG
jgi:hypothetical protein